MVSLGPCGFADGCERLPRNPYLVGAFTNERTVFRSIEAKKAATAYQQDGGQSVRYSHERVARLRTRHGGEGGELHHVNQERLVVGWHYAEESIYLANVLYFEVWPRIGGPYGNAIP